MTSERCAMLIAAALALATPGVAVAEDSGDCGAAYTVRQGDTLSAVATRCGSTVEALLGANPKLADPGRIAIGQELTVPDGDGASTAAAAPARERAEPAAARYTIEAGDSMASVAAELGLSLDDLLALNEGVDPLALQPGQEIVLPQAAADAPAAEGDADKPEATEEAEAADNGQAAAGPDEVRDADASRGAPAAVAATGRYTIEAGDSMAGIAVGLGLSLGDLRALNAGVDPLALQPGQELVVPRAAADAPADGVEQEPEGFASNDRPAAAGPDEDGGESAPATAAELARAGPERLVLEGRIRKGVECPVLIAPDGRTFSLVSQSYGFIPGDYVAIEGETVVMSFCRQGHTVRVTSMKAKRAPRGG